MSLKMPVIPTYWGDEIPESGGGAPVGVQYGTGREYLPLDPGAVSSSGGAVVLIPGAGSSPDAILTEGVPVPGVVNPSGQVAVSQGIFAPVTTGAVINEATGQPVSDLLPFLALGLLAWVILK